MMRCLWGVVAAFVFSDSLILDGQDLLVFAGDRATGGAPEVVDQPRQEQAQKQQERNRQKPQPARSLSARVEEPPPVWPEPSSEFTYACAVTGWRARIHFRSPP